MGSNTTVFKKSFRSAHAVAADVEEMGINSRRLAAHSKEMMRIAELVKQKGLAPGVRVRNIHDHQEWTVKSVEGHGFRIVVVSDNGSNQTFNPDVLETV